MSLWKSAGAAFAGLVFATVAMAATPEFVARGNEPGWILRKNDTGLTFQQMGGSEVTIAPLPHSRRVRGSRIYWAKVDGEAFRLTISPWRCVDTMSGMTYPSTVAVRLGKAKFAGCGGDPAKVLQGAWAVTAINGKPVAKGTRPTIEFGADGLVSGSASCNRYFANFKLTGEGLSIAQPGASMMMCEQPVMDQEAAFLKVLASTSRFEIGRKSELVLHSGASDTITARRK
jgi:heat shock protein HslJ/uncharacterized membrane protein